MNFAPYIILGSPHFKGKLSFLVDSGANISLIKLRKIHPSTPCFDDEKVILKGIDANVPNPLTTICYAKVELQLLDFTINHTIHAVPNDFPINFDGIIGNDFLKLNKAQVDYANDVIHINNHKIPIYYASENLNPNSNSNTNSNRNLPHSKSVQSLNLNQNQSPNLNLIQNQNRNLNHLNLNPNQSQNPNSHNEIIIPARAETMVKVNIINQNLSSDNILIPKVEVLNGVYISSCLTKLNPDNTAFVSILNVAEKPVKLKTLDIIAEEYEDTHQILSINSDTPHPNSKRLERIKDLLRLSHLNQEERESILTICYEFEKIFFLKGDKLSYTNAVQHQIPLTNITPLNAKTYRFPQIHKEEVDRQIKDLLSQGIIEPSTSPWNAPVWVVPKKSDASNEKKWRIVIDYRKLNNVSIGDSYPLPNIVEILDQLGHSKYFTTLDLKSGFHQIKMDPNDADKTAFSVPSGHYQYNRMPFGLKNAPATFQRLMNSVLAGIQNFRCFVYIDDIVIHGSDLDTHNKRLIEVFQRLYEHNLKIEPDKCEFLRKEVMYLGHLITDEGVKPDPKKIEAITNYPQLQNVKDVRAFLGLSGYYRRFIPDFSKITKPLTNLLKSENSFKWTYLEQTAFNTLKRLLTSEPILKFPDFEQPFLLATDASDFAIGSVLSQGEIGKDHPIAYASRSLNKAESNYSVIERELLAIVWSVKHFRPYLFGRKFKVLSDHRPLKWLFNVSDPSSRLVRWRLALEEYDYEIDYRPGKRNQNADCLSRIPIKTSINKIDSFNVDDNPYKTFLSRLHDSVIINNNINEFSGHFISNSENLAITISETIEPIEKHQQDLLSKFHHIKILKDKVPKVNDVIKISEKQQYIFYLIVKQYYWDKVEYETIFHALMNLKTQLIKNNLESINMPRLGTGHDCLNWNKIRSMLRYIFKNTNIKINVYHDVLIHPHTNDIPSILEENHSSLTSGHSGFHRTYNRIKSKYSWKHMKSDIRRFVKNCPSCQKNKLVRKKTKNPLEITTTSERPFEKVFLDIVGPLPLTEFGNKYILTIQDDLTKFTQAYAISTHDTKTIANHFVHRFICNFGIPTSILTDQGSDFNSNLFKDIAKLFKLKKLTTTAYHPQSNGALERTHGTITDYLRHYVSGSQTDWDTWLDFATFSFNTTIHTSTKFTPYELIFGFKPELPSSITKEQPFKYTYDDYLDQLKLKLRESQRIARENLLKSKQMNKEKYDKRINPEDFNIGDKVYLLNEKSKLNTSKKLTHKYDGPYEILQKNSSVNYTIQIKNKPILVHVNRLKRAFVTEPP